MQSENKLFEDFVKMVNGVAGTMAGMGREAESSVRERAREWMAGADFVGRDEFEAVKGIAAAARATRARDRIGDQLLIEIGREERRIRRHPQHELLPDRALLAIARRVAGSLFQPKIVFS